MVEECLNLSNLRLFFPNRVISSYFIFLREFSDFEGGEDLAEIEGG